LIVPEFSKAALYCVGDPQRFEKAYRSSERAAPNGFLHFHAPTVMF
jgi:hypothetical protein